jgi:hypothetical protein
MSISLSTSMSSARRVAVGAIGAGAVAGAMLFGATPAANAASAVPAPTVGAASAVPAPTVGGPYHVAPVFWGHHRHTNGGFHIF